MRYWAYFAAKLAAAGVALYGLLLLIDRVIPQGVSHSVKSGEKDFHKLLAPLDDMGLVLGTCAALMVWCALATAAVFFIVQDQKCRCRVCLRRLRMPLVTGSWGLMLQLGRPQVESICPYGHGTLRSEELQITGLATPEWTAKSGDMWEDLYASSHPDERK
jgi:hypothetical protein